MFFDATAQSNLTEINETYDALVAEYGVDKAVFPLLKWLKDRQNIEPYAVKDNYVFLKLELELVHLIADMEIIAHAVRRSGQDLFNNAAYRQIIGKINAYVRDYTRRSS